MDFAAALGPFSATVMSLICGTVFVIAGLRDMVNKAKNQAEDVQTTLWGICEIIGGILLMINSYGFSMLNLNNLNLSGIWFSIAICMSMIVLSAIRFFKTRQWMPSLVIMFFGVVALNTLQNFLAVMRDRSL